MAAPDYAGATTRTTIDQAREIVGKSPARWRVQPKIDGCYVRIRTGADGQVVAVTTRNGRPAPHSHSLHGQVIAPPHSIVIGEWEAHTEAGQRAAETRGHRLVHLFDALELDGVALSGARYFDRYSALMRAHVSLSMTVRGDATHVVETGRRHDADGRYAKSQPINWRLAPVIEQWTAGELETAWQELVLRGDGEGLVLVDQHARVGQRSSKRKIKLTDTHDLVCIDATDTVAMFRFAGLALSIKRPGWLAIGDTVEIACDGYYDNGCPRFARAVRNRHDLN